ncbi:hypothetical protein [Methanobrevibacter ruminantium]|uniref:hypothetical protein n=1 Tax=Methanobrevibacter ruminantium TaxID=83816 RepID=UPI0006626820|nr:hypothetical protein [Methanobrevibacter ruminantium]
MPGTVGKAKKFISTRYELDLNLSDGKLGLYQWCNLFGKIHRGQNYEDIKEDNCRMLLDLVRKYPEHSDIIYLKKVKDIGTSSKMDNSLDERINQMEEALKPVHDMVDDVYSCQINDDLINLDDFVPFEFLSEYAYKKRFWLTYNEKPDIFELETSYRDKIYSFDSVTESVIFVMDEMKNFIDKYPQYSRLIPDYSSFIKYKEKLIEEFEGE